MADDQPQAYETSGPRPFLTGPRRHGAVVPASGTPDGVPPTSGVRPYLITGGRARPIDATLSIEAQVLTTSEGVASMPILTYERRDIVGLCRRPLAVAELAASLGLHLGVTRVLVGDLVGLGLLSIHRSEVSGDHVIIERVIRGLQAIH